MRKQAATVELRSLGVGNDPELQALANRLLDVVANPRSVVGSSPTGGQEPADPVEQIYRRVGAQKIGELVDRHVSVVRDVRTRFMMDDMELLSSNIHQNKYVPNQVQDEIASLHMNIRGLIEQIATQIEDGKYRASEQAVDQMMLAYSEKKRAHDIMQADKKMHVSYQALRMTVDFFSDLNETILRRVESEVSPEREGDMVLGNAIMIYELTDFVIRYIQGFAIQGAGDIQQLHEDARRRMQDLRQQQTALERRAMAASIEPSVREQTLEDLRNREDAIHELETQWETYIGEVADLHSRVGEVRGKLPTLELIRDNARLQIGVIQIVAMLRFLKRNSDAISGTVNALKGFRLVPLTHDRVRRLLGIAS